MIEKKYLYSNALKYMCKDMINKDIRFAHTDCKYLIFCYTFSVSHWWDVGWVIINSSTITRKYNE